MKSVVFQLLTVYATFFLVIHSCFRLEVVFAQIYTILIVVTSTELAKRLFTRRVAMFFLGLMTSFVANFANYSSSVIWEVDGSVCELAQGRSPRLVFLFLQKTEFQSNHGQFLDILYLTIDSVYIGQFS